MFHTRQKSKDGRAHYMIIRLTDIICLTSYTSFNNTRLQHGKSRLTNLTGASMSYGCALFQDWLHITQAIVCNA